MFNFKFSETNKVLNQDRSKHNNVDISKVEVGQCSLVRWYGNNHEKSILKKVGKVDKQKKFFTHLVCGQVFDNTRQDRLPAHGHGDISNRLAKFGVFWKKRTKNKGNERRWINKKHIAVQYAYIQGKYCLR